MSNLALWQRFEDIDPKFTKPITGRDYSGTSPNPQYVIMCLTELFGPAGKGFGWNVLAEGFTTLGDTHLHWCRIRFWWRDSEGVNECEQYGQTKAAYITKTGKHYVDEDAPKKSLTDAVVKSASHLGIAANIFLGRWDDQKYVAEVAREYREAEKPPFDAPAAAARIKASIAKQSTPADLDELYRRERSVIDEIKAVSADLNGQLLAAFKARKAEMATAADMGGDEIPY